MVTTTRVVMCDGRNIALGCSAAQKQQENTRRKSASASRTSCDSIWECFTARVRGTTTLRPPWLVKLLSSRKELDEKLISFSESKNYIDYVIICVFFDSRNKEVLPSVLLSSIPSWRHGLSWRLSTYALASLDDRP